MNAVRALVVDDEKPARERLRHLLRRDSRVTLAGVCGGGTEALEVMREAARAGRHVQLLLLDIQMPGMDGFGVLAALVRECDPDSMPATIFVTAFDEYALRAFEAHAIDYLLKPFSDERFQAALDRAIRHVSAGHAHVLVSRLQALLGAGGEGSSPGDAVPASSALPNGPLDRIVVKGPDRVRLLPLDQISWIEAEGMYVKLHTRDGKAHLHRGLLGSLDAALDGRRFVRIHRSAIVNLDLVDELRQDAHGSYVVLMRDQTRIRVGRRFRARLQARLGQAL